MLIFFAHLAKSISTVCYIYDLLNSITFHIFFIDNSRMLEKDHINRKPLIRLLSIIEILKLDILNCMYY